MLSYMDSSGIDVELVIYGLSVVRSFELSDIPIIELMPRLRGGLRRGIWAIPPHHLPGRAIRRLYALLDEFVFEPALKPMALNRLKRRLPKYDWVIAAEWYGLNDLYKAGFPLSKTVYFSLEAEDQMSRSCADKDYVKALLSQCAFCIIQSKERRDGLTKYLGQDIDFEYLPVSMRPVKTRSRPPNGLNSTLKLVYSGYLADFACLDELVECYRRLELPFPIQLELHGHSAGYELYLGKIKAKSAGITGISITTDYQSDVEHLNYLSQFDTGLAFYQDSTGSSNWQGLLFSSGKIATYLWAGLAVMTNIQSPETVAPPFLYVRELTPEAIACQLEAFASRREEFQRSAIDFANRHYNLDLFMGKILGRILECSGDGAPLAIPRSQSSRRL